MNFAPAKIEWRNRTSPLAPEAAVAFGTAARRLAEKLLSLGDENLSALQGVAATAISATAEVSPNDERLIFVAGEFDRLPWTDGIVYLGKDERLPASIMLPTTLEPIMPAELFGRVIEKNFRDVLPCAVLPEKIIRTGEARNLSRRVVERWLAENK